MSKRYEGDDFLFTEALTILLKMQTHSPSEPLFRSNFNQIVRFPGGDIVTIMTATGRPKKMTDSDCKGKLTVMAGRQRRIKKLETRLNSVASPVFLLDGNRQVEFFNEACEQLTGWLSADVVGKLCHYNTEADPEVIDSITGCLCPPPSVYDGQHAIVPTHFVHRNGSSLSRQVHFTPLSDDKGRVTGVIGVVLPLDDSTSAEPVPYSQQLHAELASLRITLRQKYALESSVCQSQAMDRVLQQLGLAQATNSPVTFSGPRGVGKEHFARVIHYNSAMGNRAFVPLDCRRLSALALKNTLFRLFKQDDDMSAVPALSPGTLFLAHVESLPRDLQERIVTAYEKPKADRPDMQLMASSLIPPETAFEAEQLRDDFYYMITPLQIAIPELRKRRVDIEPLAQHFLERRNRRSERQLTGFSDEVWDRFREYNWPANLDELETVVNESHAACDASMILPKHLPFRFRTGEDAQKLGPIVESQAMPLEAYLATAEAEQIENALRQSRYNKSKAAELLGIPRARLYRRMQSLGIADHEAGES